MKTLYVLRHGEAAPETEVTSDYERPLTLRGRSDVQRAAKLLVERERLPTLVLSSSARRARQTAELCCSAWQVQQRRVDLVLIDELYLAGPSSYVSELGVRAAEHDVVMVVGHNPGLEALVHLVTEQSEHLATAALVAIELGISSWGELARAPRGAGRLDFGRPRGY
jgi:phosphohistidine phosphatase